MRLKQNNVTHHSVWELLRYKRVSSKILNHSACPGEDLQNEMVHVFGIDKELDLVITPWHSVNSGNYKVVGAG